MTEGNNEPGASAPVHALVLRLRQQYVLLNSRPCQDNPEAHPDLYLDAANMIEQLAEMVDDLKLAAELAEHGFP